MNVQQCQMGTKANTKLYSYLNLFCMIRSKGW